MKQKMKCLCNDLKTNQKKKVNLETARQEAQKSITTKPQGKKKTKILITNLSEIINFFKSQLSSLKEKDKYNKKLLANR